MDVVTPYGTCKNVDSKHMTPYLCDITADTACFCFTDNIFENDKGDYLLFGFEVWRDVDDTFHFFVEEGHANGCSETKAIEIDDTAKAYIQKLFYDFMT